MWLELVTTMRLVLSIFLSILLQDAAIAEVEHTATLRNISSTVLTGPLSNVSIHSTVEPENLPSNQYLEITNISVENKYVMVNSTALRYAIEPTPKRSEERREMVTEILSKVMLVPSSVDHIETSSQMVILKNTPIIVALSISVQPSTATNKQEPSSIQNSGQESNENISRSILEKHSVSIGDGSLIKPEKPTVISNAYETTLPEIAPDKSEILMPITSSRKPEQSSVTPSIQGKTNITDTENKRNELMLNMTSLKAKQSLVTATALEMALTRIAQVDRIANFTASIPLQKSEVTPVLNPLQKSDVTTVLKRKDTSMIYSKVNKSYTRTEQSASYSKVISEQSHIQINSTIGISLVKVKQANNTVVLQPSPSLNTKQRRSKIEMEFTSPVVDITGMPYSKSMNEGRIYSKRNDTSVQHSKTKVTLFTYSHTSTVNDTMENIPDKTMSMNENRTIEVEVLVSKATIKENITMSSSVLMFGNKTLIPNPSQVISSSSYILGMIRPSSILSSFYKTVSNRTEEIQVSRSMTIAKKPQANHTKLGIASTYSIKKMKISDKGEEIKRNSTASFAYITREYSTPVPTRPTNTSSVSMLGNKTLIPSRRQGISTSEMRIPSDIPPIANRTTITRYTHISDQFRKMSSNQTQIPDNFTTFGMIRPSSILSSFYKTVSNRTEEIQVSPSMTIAKKPHANHTKLRLASTYSIKKIKISDKSEEIKPNSTASFAYSTREYSTPVPTPPIKVKEQQFRVTFKITSEQFKKEYEIKSSTEFKMKSREIEVELGHVFRNMTKYLFTEVLRFFSGSLGCDVIIHTESKESEPVSVDEVNNILEQAKNTEEGFRKYVVDDIDVEEKNPDVQARDEDEKDTWGRMPIIVISILGGVCLVLIVMVISQCIQKRHYSHSLAESNEIQEYSPAIHLKNNDDIIYKDEERVPMTTFNQTDIY